MAGPGPGPRARALAFVVGMRAGAAPAAALLKEGLVRSLFLLAGGPPGALFNVVAFSSQARRGEAGRGAPAAGGRPPPGARQGPGCCGGNAGASCRAPKAQKSAVNESRAHPALAERGRTFAHHFFSSLFSQVFKWREGLVGCSLGSVTEAAAWIRSLRFEDGAKAASGLAAAWEDPACQSVYLFTDALPEQESEEICQLLAESGSRPVHVVCFLGDSDDRERSKGKTMEKVARQSGGSFQAIRLPPTASEKVCHWYKISAH